MGGRSVTAVRVLLAYATIPVNPGGGLAGSVRLARSHAARLAAALRRKPTLGKWRHSAWLPFGLVLGSPTSIEHACLSDERLAVRVASCGSCRERFAARRVREYVSSDVSLCTSYQS